MRPRLLFYIQHLLGIGHLVRGARIAAAAADLFDVTVVLGGERPPGIAFGNAAVVNLPPVKAGPGGFSALVTPQGLPFDAQQQAARRDRLLGLLQTVEPDILLIETYPFGRRALEFELKPLLDAAWHKEPRPLVASSIRDILQETRRPGRDADIVAAVLAWFDCVLVHGDPNLARLEESFPLAPALADRLRYTGLVGPADPDAELPPDDIADVIVSVGGGAVGLDLIRLALAAKPLSRLAEASWLVLTGPNLPGGVAPRSGGGVTVRPFVSDLRLRLRHARLSLSQAGYNTVADLLEAPACRAVLVPYVGDGETEQTKRAALLERAGVASVVAAEDLTARRLAMVMDAALDKPLASLVVERDGARRSAVLLQDALAQLRHGT